MARDAEQYAISTKGLTKVFGRFTAVDITGQHVAEELVIAAQAPADVLFAAAVVNDQVTPAPEIGPPLLILLPSLRIVFRR